MPRRTSVARTVIFALLVTPSVAAEEAGSELIELVVDLLHDRDQDIRALALEQVRSEAPGPIATEVFSSQLPQLAPDGQVGLLSALADRGDGAARPAVLKLLSVSDNDAVRVAAVKALGAVGQPADTRLLVATLNAASSHEKAAARASLVRLGGESVPESIVGEMAQADPNVRVAVFEILTARRALETIPDILSCTVDTDRAVRTAAMTALGQLAGPEHIPGMVPGVLAAEPGRERDAAEKCVMFVCQRIPDPDRRAKPLLAAMEDMEDLNNADRLTLLSTLGRVGGPGALKLIEATLADADPNRHEIGLRALCNWPDASIAPRLIELATTEESASHRIRALRALIRVAPLPDDRSDGERLALLSEAMKLATRDKERLLALDRARAIRTLATLQWIVPYIDQRPCAEQACLSVVELAHHRELRETNTAEFHRALDIVIQTSQDAVVVDRAKRYKNNQTWVGPAKSN